MKKAEKVWTFRGGNYGHMDGYAEATLEKTDEHDRPHFIIAQDDLPTEEEIVECLSAEKDPIVLLGMCMAVGHVLAQLGLQRRE